MIDKDALIKDGTPTDEFKAAVKAACTIDSQGCRYPMCAEPRSLCSIRRREVEAAILAYESAMTDKPKTSIAFDAPICLHCGHIGGMETLTATAISCCPERHTFTVDQLYQRGARALDRFIAGDDSSEKLRPAEEVADGIVMEAEDIRPEHRALRYRNLITAAIKADRERRG